MEQGVAARRVALRCRHGLCCVNRFRLDDLAPHIYRTHDGGTDLDAHHQRPRRRRASQRGARRPERKGCSSPAPRRRSMSRSTMATLAVAAPNMPATSIRDLVVHGRRSCHRDARPRLLDPRRHHAAAADRPRIRQSRDAHPVHSPARVASACGVIEYRHAAAARRSGGPESARRRDHRLLPRRRALSPITLEIRTAAGVLVRRYASNDQPAPFDEQSVNVPTYWIRPAARAPRRGYAPVRMGPAVSPPPGSIRHEYPDLRRFSATRRASRSVSSRCRARTPSR